MLRKLMRELTTNCILNQATRLIICVPILWTTHVETVALLSHQKLTEYVQIPYEPEDKTAHAFRDATYKEIKDWIKKVFDMKVSSLYIAQIKDECGLEKRQNYNKSKKENAKVPTCPKEKRKAILAALRHFQMIDNE